MGTDLSRDVRNDQARLEDLKHTAAKQAQELKVKQMILLGTKQQDLFALRRKLIDQVEKNDKSFRGQARLNATKSRIADLQAEIKQIERSLKN